MICLQIKNDGKNKIIANILTHPQDFTVTKHANIIPHTLFR